MSPQKRKRVFKTQVAVNELKDMLLVMDPEDEERARWPLEEQRAHEELLGREAWEG